MTIQAKFVSVGLALCGLLGGQRVFCIRADDADITATRIANAVRLMATLYPDEHEKANRVQITGRISGMDARFFGVQLGVGELVAGDNPARSNCYAVFAFWEGGLSNYNAHGRCVNESENAAFESAIHDHPVWSNERIARELSIRGAQFGPDAKDRVIDRTPPVYLISELTGDAVRLREVLFQMPEREDNKIGPGSYMPTWVVTFDVLGSDYLRVLVSIEPFRGRVTSIFSTREVGVPG